MNRRSALSVFGLASLAALAPRAFGQDDATPSAPAPAAEAKVAGNLLSNPISLAQWSLSLIHI